jgi:hypothetical protein
MTKTSSNYFGQWSDTQVAVICTGGDNIIGISEGILSTAGTQQVERIGVLIFKRGMQPNVTMQLKAYRDSILVGTSDLWTVSEIEEHHNDQDNFLGWVRFTFSPRLNLSADDLTSLELQLGNYTYDEATTWIGACLDWPTTMGYNTVPGTITASPVALELYGQAAIR